MVAIGPLPSIGRPSESTTRPIERVADRDREDAPGRLDRAALLHVAGLAEHDRTDRGFVEVQRETERAALELEHLVDRGLGQPGDARDAVTHLEHLADVGRVEGGRERGDVRLERGGDLFDVDGQLCHLVPSDLLWPQCFSG